MGSELSSDHPGATDPVYRDRRREFADKAIKYRHADPEIPRVNYTDAEKETWSVVYDKLTALFPTHACKQFNDVFPELALKCGYRRDNIPQLEDVSQYLQRYVFTYSATFRVFLF